MDLRQLDLSYSQYRQLLKTSSLFWQWDHSTTQTAPVENIAAYLRTQQLHLVKMSVEPAQVFVQVSAVEKPLIAELADVHSVVRVRPHVNAQLRSVVERFSAAGARVRPHVAMKTHVQSELARAVPDLAADRASEWPVVRMMRLHVAPQLNNRCKPNRHT